MSKDTGIWLRMTVELEYHARPQFYGTSDPEKMARIDKKNIDDDPETLFGLIADCDYTVKIEPI